MTSLKGGKKVPKYDKRIETNGNVDELISYMGLIRSQDIEESDKEIIIKIQNTLMNCASIIATESISKQIGYTQLKEVDIEMLETEIDRMENELPPQRSFILPGGHTIVSFCHIARTVCRRAERKIAELSEEVFLPEFIIKYFNRLSDYLYVLARKTAFNLKVNEIHWTTNL
jgi:cob(I)alamin adenosyltransferase